MFQATFYLLLVLSRSKFIGDYIIMLTYIVNEAKRLFLAFGLYMLILIIFFRLLFTQVMAPGVHANEKDIYFHVVQA